MSEPLPPQQELDRLLDRLCDEQQFTNDDSDRLADLLRGNPQLRQRYLGRMELHARLWLLGGELESEKDHFGTDTEIESPAARTASVSPRLEALSTLTRRRPRLVSFSIAAAVLLLVITTMAFMAPPFYRAITAKNNVESLDEYRVVAKLTGLHEAVWADGQTATRQGSTLQSGQRLELNEGWAEVTFHNGAMVLLEGPCHFVTEVASAGRLHQGKLTAHVPERAVGFTVRTPTVDVVDLGTDFGVSVDAEGAGEVQVFSGTVDVATNSDKSHPARRLLAGQSLQFDRDGLLLAANGEPPTTPRVQFTRHMPGIDGLPADATYEQIIATLKPVAWYRMEADEGDVLQDSSEGEHHGEIRSNRNPDAIHVEGKIGGALNLNGKGDDAIVADYPKAQHGQLTVMAWVYAESKPAWGSIAKNWGGSISGQFHLGLTRDGTRLSIYISDAEGRQVAVIDPDPFPVGQWQHVAFVCTGSAVGLYRNGRLVASQPCHGIDYPSQLNALGIGCKLSDRNSVLDRGGATSFWHGRLDELAIFHTACSGTAIRKLSELDPN